MKRLKEPERPVGRYFERVEALEDKLGPIVFQLPGQFKPDRARLANFLEALPVDHRYAFEFRDPAWFQPEILEDLAARNVALCLYEFAASRRCSRSPPTSSTSACTALGALSRLVQRRSAADLGQAHPRLDQSRPRRLLLLRQ